LRAAATLLRIIGDAKAHRGKALIAHINHAINLLIRPAPGAWVGALEVLTFADGDCKDYSIAKFFALREAGLPPERLRLVIVRNPRRLDDHMVVAAYDEGTWFILDNATMVLATDKQDATRYIPLFYSTMRECAATVEIVVFGILPNETKRVCLDTDSGGAM
jgi:predicted transglutaminase-like cysteine proteinase